MRTRSRVAWRWVLSFAFLLATAVVPARAGAVEPAVAPASPSPPAPAHSSGLHRSTTGGMLVLALTYGLALGIPIRDGFTDGREWLAVPLVGPFGALARRVGPPWGLAFDGLGQLLGTSLIAAGASVSWETTAAAGTRGTAKMTTLRLRGSF